jgi:hypothetical protein
LHGSALGPLVGRDEEIDLLLRRWARAKAGDGQVVLISGEPGIGKSRIAAALEEREARAYVAKAGYVALAGCLSERPAYRKAQNTGHAVTEGGGSGSSSLGLGGTVIAQTRGSPRCQAINVRSSVSPSIVSVLARR